MYWEYSDIIVYLDNTPQDSGYTVSTSDERQGCVVVFDTAPAIGVKIAISRVVSIARLSEFEESSSFRADVTNEELNHIYAAIQQINEVTQRCVKVEISDEETPEELLAEVYAKLDSATAVATRAIAAANQAQRAADNATAAVTSAEQTLTEVQAYVDEAETTINSLISTAQSTINQTVTTAQTTINQTVTDAQSSIAQTVSDAESSITSSIQQAIADVEAAAVAAAQEVIDDAAESVTATAQSNVNSYVNNTIKPDLQNYTTNAAASAAAAAQSLSDVQNEAAAFNTNYQTKLSAFNTNAAAKQAAVDASANAAAASESAASTSESNAATSASNAATSAAAALTSEQRAAIIAEGSQAEIQSLNNNLTRSAMDWSLLAAHNAAGIVPDNLKMMKIENDGTNTKLYWKDPLDTVVEGQVICTWHATYIVRQTGRYPENVEDGTVLLVNTTRDQYATTPFEVADDGNSNYYYSAFPASSEGAKNLSPRNRFGVWLFGVVIDESDPVESTCVTYDENCDNRFYQHAYMDFANDKFEFGDWENYNIIPKHCMLGFDGEIKYWLDESNYRKKADGTASDVADVNYAGNAMAAFPRVFVKEWRERGKKYIQFSNIQIDSGFKCDRCLKSDGTYAEYSFGPMFEGTKDSAGRMRSIATGGRPLASTTAEAERTAAKLNGSGHDITTWADEKYWRQLFILMFKRLNSQAAIGYGATASSSALTVNCGCTLDKAGGYWGSSAASANGMKCFGMENLTSHRWRRFAGCLLINGVYKVKYTKSTQDGSTTDDYNLTGSGYIDTGVAAPSASESYITKTSAGTHEELPTNVGGSSTTYYSDAMWTNLSGTMMPLSGGAVYDGVADGVFAFACNGAPSDSVWDFGASLSYHAL